MAETNLCTFCGEQIENLLHLFVYCEKVQIIWKQVETFVKRFTSVKLNTSPKAIICNSVHSKPTHIVNFVCLIVKQYIYRKKCQKDRLDIRELKASILQQENIEKYIAQKHGKLGKHIAKWYPCDYKERRNNNVELYEYVDQYIQSM